MQTFKLSKARAVVALLVAGLAAVLCVVSSCYLCILIASASSFIVAPRVFMLGILGFTLLAALGGWGAWRQLQRALWLWTASLTLIDEGVLVHTLRIETHHGPCEIRVEYLLGDPIALRILGSGYPVVSCGDVLEVAAFQARLRSLGRKGAGA